MFTLSVTTQFSAAHSLRNYPGLCANIHGHNWRVVVEVCSKKLDKTGMVLDFKSIKKQIEEISNKLDHQYINDVSPFDEINPTTENLTKWFFDSISQKINQKSIAVKSVTIHETERYSVSYSEPVFMEA